MKKTIAIALLALLVGCTSSTEHGKCIGAFDEKDPKLVYKVSVFNTVMAIIFIETIVVPVWVVVDEALCPVSKKPL